MYFPILVTLRAIVIIGLIGGDPHWLEAAWPEPRPLGRTLSTFQPPVLSTDSPAATPVFKEPTGAMTLGQAVALALINNPSLAAFAWEVRSREARTLQAGMLPNPEISGEFEDFGGSGGFRGVRQAQTTIQLSQLIELGGKRAKRRQVAVLDHDLAGWDYETQRLEVLTRVTKAFLTVVSAQQRLTLSEDSIRIAEQVVTTVSARVSAGKVLPVEESKAHVALSFAQIELARAKRILAGAREHLAAEWGSRRPRFARAEGDLGPVLAPPSLEDLSQRLTQNPALARWATEVSRHQEVVSLEKSNRIPDITISGGYRRFNETDDNAFVMSVALPLPLLNRNQGELLSARYQQAQAESARRDAEIRVSTQLAESYTTLATAYAEVTILTTEILPRAQSVFESTSEGYRVGKFDFLSVLDAQRTLFNAQAQRLEALTGYHTAVADVEHLIGEPLAAIAPIPHKKR